MSNPHYGSLGDIEWKEGVAYTKEDKGYAMRVWFGDSRTKALSFLEKFLKSYGYIMGEDYLEKLPENCIEKVRGEYTIKICFDLGQTRMNNLSTNL